MKTVLIVDQDRAFAEGLQKVLTAQDGYLRVLTAEDGWTATKTLTTEAVNLVVAGFLRLPGKGLKFLEALGEEHPEIPVIVVCATCPPEARKTLCSLGFYRCFVKPADPQELGEAIHEALDGTRDGYLAGFSLGSLLQIVELEKKTCTLRVESEDREGRLFIRDGELLDAKAGDTTGEGAAFEIMTWEETRTEIQGTCRKTRRAIPYSLSHLLLEALRRKDESQKDLSDGDKRTAII